MKHRFKVYLAGPIAGLTFDGCTDWREYVRLQLQPEVEGYSPMRAKDFLKDSGVLPERGADQLYKHPMTTDHGIMTRDHWDCMTSDLIFVNFLGAKKISMGTVMELGFAFCYRKPVVCVIEPDGSNVHEHGMVSQAINYRVSSLEEGIHLTKCILLGS